MRRRWMVIALSMGISVGLTVGGARAEDRRMDPSRLVIMTFNAEFLWDGIEPEEGQANFIWKGSEEDALEHMEDIAAVIIQHNPDIINLVEVEGMPALRLFNDRFLAGRGYKPYLVEGKDTATGQDVALLTRIDPENERIERTDRQGKSGPVEKSVSKNYFAKFTINERKIALIGVHFLANPHDQSRIHPRQAQADAIQTLALELRGEQYSPIILGDFNDYDGAFDSLDHRGNFPITNVIEQCKTLDTVDPSDDLVNLISLVPKALRYTAFWDRDDDFFIDGPEEFSAIDHILVANELVSAIDYVDIPHQHDPRLVSDHFPVIVAFKFEIELAPTSVKTVRIVRLLANPVGDETHGEAVAIKNEGPSPIDLNGWTLRDLARQTWSLSGQLGAGETLVFHRNGQAMALNNRGDTVDLIDPDGEIVHTVSYPRALEGDWLEF